MSLALTTSPGSAPSALVGSTEPRIFVPPLRELTPDTSFGFAVVDFARDVLDEPLMPWQEWLVIHAGELLPSGRPRFKTVLVLVARQNGKTHLCKVLALWWLFVDKQKLVLGTSTTLEYAKESWNKAVETAQDNPYLARHIPPRGARRAASDISLTTVDRCRYKIAAATEKGGRSLTVNRLILDELRQHKTWAAWSASTKAQNAVWDAQRLAVSNAGDSESVVLNDLRGKAISAIETGDYPEEPIGLFEYSAPDDCDTDDPAGWVQANPSLGNPHGVTQSAIAEALSTDPPAVFRTEVLCQRVDALGDLAVPAADWAACLDPGMKVSPQVPNLALCVDISPDLQHATLIAAALGHDELVRVWSVASWEGPLASRQAAAEFGLWKKRLKPRKIGYFPAGPAAGVSVDLDKLGAEGIPAAGTTAACQALTAQVLGRQLVHNGDPLLTAHITGAKKWPVSDGWRFVRKGVGHVDAAYAAAGAVQLARTLPPPARAVVLVGRNRKADS
jgi:hypothetical protein